MREHADAMYAVREKQRAIFQTDSIRAEFHTTTIRTDSPRTSQIQVYITADSTTVGKGMDRILFNLRKKPPISGGDFLLHIGQDTLSTAELYRAYTQALRANRIPMSFYLEDTEKPLPKKDENLRSMPAYGGLLAGRFYTAVFPDYQPFLLRKMLIYALFALVVFGITGAAFGIMYRSLQQQRRLARLKNDFISNVTHELKTPITTVGVALEALSDFEVLRNPDQTREYLSISKLELERLTLLVDKVLRLSMFEQNEPALRLERVDLAALIGQVLHALKLQIESAGATLVPDIPEGETFEVQGDRLHLTSVVFNLLDNALKYRREQPVIQVSLKKTDSSLLFSVRDNGIGIAPEYQSRIFEKFFRVPTGDTHNVKGHGLGLNYVSNVVRQHGGNIRVESVPGAGSNFIVEFPLTAPGASEPASTPACATTAV